MVPEYALHLCTTTQVETSILLIFKSLSLRKAKRPGVLLELQ